MTEAFFTIEGATVDASNLVVSEPALPPRESNHNHWNWPKVATRDDFEFIEFLNIGKAHSRPERYPF